MNKVARKELKKLKVDMLDIYFTVKKLDDKITLKSFLIEMREFIKTK